MIPLKDNVPTRRFPFVCVALIVANVVVFLLDQLTGQSVEIRRQLPNGYYLVQREFNGGLASQYAMIPAQVTASLGEYWPTVFTSMFLHANWLHILGNMWFLWIFGNNVEDALGRVRFVLFYFVCGVAAAAAQVYSDPTSTIPTVGASGAIAGVMGAYLMLFPGAGILSIVPLFGFIGTIIEVPAILVIGFWALIQFLNANMLGGGGMLRGGGVAYYAHVGGFIAGILIVLMLGGRRLVANRDSRSRFSDGERYERWR